MLELEILQLGIEGKAAGWRALRRLADHDDRLDTTLLDDLTTRARRQVESVENLRLQTASVVLPAQVHDRSSAA